MSRVIPFNDRILVRRKKIGEKAGSIIMPDVVKERATDIAEVVYVSELTFGDKEILDNAPQIIQALTKKAIGRFPIRQNFLSFLFRKAEGSDSALIALLRINEFVKMKSIQAGDLVMIGKYVGTDFHETGENDNLTLVKEEDVIGLIMKDEVKNA